MKIECSGVQARTPMKLLEGYCAYPDEESALDLSLVESMGVNSKNPLISTHDYAKYLVIMVDTLTKVEL